MILVTVNILPNEIRKEVLLAGVPNVGHSIRLKNGISDKTLVVEHVLWMEGEQEPSVLVVVRQH